MQGIHSCVLTNFTRVMNVSTDDIMDIQYTISSTQNYRNHYEIEALTVYMVDGFSYTFTSDENPHADGRIDDIVYSSYMTLPPYGSPDDEWDWVENRIAYGEVSKLPARITEALSTGAIEGDIIVSVPPTKASFVKHHKKLVKIDRRRKVPEIYKEWDETISYYPVTLMNPPRIEDPPMDTYECPTPVQYIPRISVPVSIGWSDDEW